MTILPDPGGVNATAVSDFKKTLWKKHNLRTALRAQTRQRNIRHVVSSNLFINRIINIPLPLTSFFCRHSNMSHLTLGTTLPGSGRIVINYTNQHSATVKKYQPFVNHPVISDFEMMLYSQSKTSVCKVIDSLAQHYVQLAAGSLVTNQKSNQINRLPLMII